MNRRMTQVGLRPLAAFGRCVAFDRRRSRADVLTIFAVVANAWARRTARHLKVNDLL